ncbi:GMC oxidoreductase-domain-containing protein [Mycena crocata]|nr:GMC oxidoreductase-domain-containing protein [Mycena crocata]
MWPFSSPYPQFSVQQLDGQYDFIVLGGGNAGCVLARRLSEDGKNTVLLVEKGDTGDSWLNRTPLTSFHHWSDGKHSTVLDSTVDPKFGRSFPLVTGVGLGGTTRINGGQYTCGVPAEYNAWRDEGRPGWGYDDLRPYFKKSQTWLGPVPEEWHGSEGPLTVCSFPEYNYGSSKVAAQAATDLGFLPILDQNSPLQPSIGWTKMQYTVAADGSRHSASRAYLPKVFADSMRHILHICTQAIAAKLSFSTQADGRLRADSVEIQSVDGGQIRVIKARREIVVACGALETPKLLMLSGVGPKEHLEKMGIEVIRHSPGVGANLQDHAFIATGYNCPLSDSMWAMIRRPQTLISQLYQYLRCGRGWFLCTSTEVEIFGMSSRIGPDGKPNPVSAEEKDPFNPENRPDFAVLACPMADPRGPKVDRSKGFFGLNCTLLGTESRGEVRLRSRDLTQNPLCEMRYLSSLKDATILRTALRVCGQLAAQMRSEGYALDDVRVPRGMDDESLDEFINERVETMFHYTSSCRMAPEDDPLPGVVDPELRVHGVSNLRISDASILPNGPAAHPQALVYAVAEKCGDMILSAPGA